MKGPKGHRNFFSRHFQSTVFAMRSHRFIPSNYQPDSESLRESTKKVGGGGDRQSRPRYSLFLSPSPLPPSTLSISPARSRRRKFKNLLGNPFHLETDGLLLLAPRELVFHRSAIHSCGVYNCLRWKSHLLTNFVTCPQQFPRIVLDPLPHFPCRLCFPSVTLCLFYAGHTSPSSAPVSVKNPDQIFAPPSPCFHHRWIQAIGRYNGRRNIRSFMWLEKVSPLERLETGLG